LVSGLYKLHEYLKDTVSVLDTVIFPESEPLSAVDCLAAKLPLKLLAPPPPATTTTPKPTTTARKWVHKWSQHCRRPRGQFRYPDDCHAYVDCWDGSGRLQYCHPRDLVFNEATGQCDWPRNVPCVIGNGQQTAPTSPTVAATPSANSASALDLDRPDCADYAALGYKCVNFWECSPTNNIVDDPAAEYGESFVDARMVPPKKPKPSGSRQGVFEPLAKKCPGTYQVCCRGQCKAAAATASAKRPASQLDTPQASALCPAEFVGPRPVPGLCTKFAECYKGRATIKDCPPGTHFCRVSLMCDWPRKAVCEQLSAIAQRSPRDSAQSDEPKYIFVHGSKVTTPYPPTVRPLDATADLAAEQFARNAGVLLPAPPSGQTIRLRQGKSPSEGYLQLFHNNRWGYVCDSGTWSLAEAAIVCYQLGLSRGVRKTTQVCQSHRYIQCANTKAYLHPDWLNAGSGTLAEMRKFH
jgi:hypothetical protein